MPELKLPGESEPERLTWEKVVSGDIDGEEVILYHVPEFSAVKVAGRVLEALNAEIIKRGGDPTSLKAYSATDYARGIDQAAAAYWKEGVTGNFFARMRQVTKFGLRDAFDAGGADMGITPDDYTEQDIALRDEIITEEQSHINDLLGYLDGLANNAQAKLSDAAPRLDLWKARFDDMRNRAKMILGKDAKLEWVYGDTEHCETCARLNGVVKRASFWQSHGVLPQSPPNPMLKCGGWKCQCSLEPTDKPLTRGRMPRTP
jgi:hypothetical protein